MREDVEQWLGFGERLDEETLPGDGETMAAFLAARLLKVRDREGLLRPLVANRAQRAFEARRGRRNIVLKARQMGMTTWVAGLYFLRTVLRPGVLTVQVAHTREAAEGIFRVVERMWVNLPGSLRTGLLARSRANVGQMVFRHLDSEFRVVSAADENAGRGLTIQNLHVSELSRWPGNAAATLAGLRAALAPGGQETIESTPNGAQGCFYDEWMRAGDSQLVKHFAPWWLEPAYVAGAVAELEWTAAERALVTGHGLTAEQIGFRRGLERGFSGLRLQEYAEDAVACFRSSGACCFEVAALERRLELLRQEPVPRELRRRGALEIWLPPLAGKEYLIGVDTAGGGTAGDYAAAQVIELRTGLQCAELQERLGPAELARVVAALGREYAGASGPALLVVERNNHGAAVLVYLDEAERYPRVYGQDGVAGWLTSAGSKPRMIVRLGVLLAESAELFRSTRLLMECRSFIAHANGSTSAAGGAHDDCLMAMAIVQAVRAEDRQQRD